MSVGVDLEGGLPVPPVVAEEFFEGNDSGDGKSHLARNQGLAGDGGQGLQGDAPHYADGGDDTHQQVGEDLLAWKRISFLWFCRWELHCDPSFYSFEKYLKVATSGGFFLMSDCSVNSNTKIMPNNTQLDYNIITARHYSIVHACK